MPHIDSGEPRKIIFTVCDNAANEVCPACLGQPMTALWGFGDPAAFIGSQDQHLAKFRDIYLQLKRRIQIFTSLPIASLDKLSLQDRLHQIGCGMSKTV